MRTETQILWIVFLGVGAAVLGMVVGYLRSIGGMVRTIAETLADRVALDALLRT